MWILDSAVTEVGPVGQRLNGPKLVGSDVCPGLCTPPTLPAPRSNRLPALKHYHEEARYKLNMLCVGPLSTFTRNEKKGGRIQTNMANGKVIHYFYFLPYVNLLEFIQ